MTRRAHGLGFLMAAATLGTLLWNVDRPAIWMDESASVVATQRSWSDLWTLRGGAEAPLMPYYAVLKVVTAVLTRLSSAATAHPELLYRLPSLAAAVLGAWILAFWLAKRGPIVLTVATTTALLVTGGFSRYGQEARPYAFTLLAAVVATVAWATMVGDPRRRWIAVYAGSVVLLVATHLLAGSLVAAHLLAALIATPPPSGSEAEGDRAGVRAQRRSAVLRTIIGAGIGLAVVAPFAVPASGRGVGPIRESPLTWSHLSTTFLELFTEGAGLPPGHSAPILGIGVLLLVAGIGLVQVFLLDHRFIARLAAAWAVVPLLVLFPVIVSKPNLILGRYLVFLLPAWAILAGLGVVTVVDLVRRWSGENAVLRTATGGLAAVLVLAALVVTQAQTLTGVRAPGGHTEDIRPALALADRPKYADLPIVMSAPDRAIEISVYRRADESRLLGTTVQRNQNFIWPIDNHLGARERSRTHPRLVVLVRDPSRAAKCPGKDLADYVWHCMPKWVRQEGYRVERAEEVGDRWTFAVLQRRSDNAETAPDQDGL